MPTVRDRVGRNTPLGANIVSGGVTFRVLAPAAREMYVLTGASLPAGQAPGFAPSASDQLFNLGDNTWGAFLPGLGEGDPYRFWVVGSAGSGLNRDPRINAVHLLSTDESPTETSLGYNNLDFYSPEMAYEVHDAQELARYLAKANALLATRGQSPLTLDQLAPGPNQLKCLIDILHLSGVAVFYDLVYNHAGSPGGFDPQCINFFDLQSTTDENLSLYFTDQTYVGGRVFAYWNADIRQFLIDNAVFCVNEYHI